MKSRLYGSIYDDPEMMDLIEKSKKRIFIINPPFIRSSKKRGTFVQRSRWNNKIAKSYIHGFLFAEIFHSIAFSFRYSCPYCINHAILLFA